MAVNAATALAKAEPGSTLLVDLNVACGDAAVFLGAEPRFSVMDALENVQRLDAAFFKRARRPHQVGPRPAGRVRAAGHRQFRLRAHPHAARLRQPDNRFTVLDVPRSDTVALDSLDSATKIVLVVNQELATVRTASRMAATLRQRYGQSRLHLVLTRTDRRAEIGHEDVERTVGVEIAHTFPSDYRLALQAMNKGRPLVLDASARAVEGVHRLLARSGRCAGARTSGLKKYAREASSDASLRARRNSHREGRTTRCL